jgi:hypothetical protein
MSNVTSTIYNIAIGLEEGKGSLQVRLTKDVGNVELTLFIDRCDDSMIEKTVMTFTKDSDLKAVIEALKWARVANLKSKGYKVIT